ncbi:MULTISPECIES: hypothetical protein [unclassified Pseudomonas]|uniref:hypothetical protein n=1 Tax=unclassified Pseudomonas TaxID=196821 RepID=UPI0011B36D08|nr:MULTISPECIES: hypothetical protein [unclassified Pseudomonas]
MPDNDLAPSRAEHPQKNVVVGQATNTRLLFNCITTACTAELVVPTIVDEALHVATGPPEEKAETHDMLECLEPNHGRVTRHCTTDSKQPQSARRAT